MFGRTVKLLSSNTTWWLGQDHVKQDAYKCLRRWCSPNLLLNQCCWLAVLLTSHSHCQLASSQSYTCHLCMQLRQRERERERERETEREREHLSKRLGASAAQSWRAWQTCRSCRRWGTGGGTTAAAQRTCNIAVNVCYCCYCL